MAYIRGGNYGLPAGAPGWREWPGGVAPADGTTLTHLLAGVDAAPPFALGRFIAERFPAAVDKTDGAGMNVYYLPDLEAFGDICVALANSRQFFRKASQLHAKIEPPLPAAVPEQTEDVSRTLSGRSGGPALSEPSAAPNFGGYIFVKTYDAHPIAPTPTILKTTGLYPLALCSAAFSSAYAAKMRSPGGPEVDQESPERLAVVLYALATGWRCKNACIADSGKRERRGISRHRRAGSARTSYIQVVREESASGETLTAGPLDVVRQEQEDVEEAAGRVAADAAVQTEDHIPEETTKEKTEKAATKEEALATAARRSASMSADQDDGVDADQGGKRSDQRGRER
ncbi:hypothetical protein PHYSODRAFT_336391 [Phytophthora sojae]|uniref:Uncharacterized protein n=1 Tax=Phytophthora sojae (strain P6497) TaxID=1094619 RepID=G4ZXU0_PHYSP|nr:hypothetical protein PHYSODRAFT_336391 [Phytophthora sojae]EGZ11898.1 hypothetical protein PHYSODRAFT_336391 [Phytophthora sojae]|eukprot:XP_009532231.1 hypothetical protein PHYSODRAFT_336391 [Phytophthora sojae]